ncbi:hypothetical protein HHI36_000679 [Cryptolaemus montrouzieri]|uniref:Uncharacterized protein n=1 Tax=Cryptolaemus montrouzieri TaxID=559131 RepID=A0ABD2P634_9CUCU
MVFPFSEGNSDDDSNQTSHVDGIMMPQSNINGKVTDEDSGDEDQVRPSNSPGSQLSARAEIYSGNQNRDDDFDPEDEIFFSGTGNKTEVENERKEELSSEEWRLRSSANGMAIFQSF